MGASADILHGSLERVEDGCTFMLQRNKEYESAHRGIAEGWAVIALSHSLFGCWSCGRGIAEGWAVIAPNHSFCFVAGAATEAYFNAEGTATSIQLKDTFFSSIAVRVSDLLTRQQCHCPFSVTLEIRPSLPSTMSHGRRMAGAV
eukprot:1097966-Pelagomonas_calceolata.AAC.1